MRNVGRKLAFVLAASNHGTMIVNRFDYRMLDSEHGIGVGFEILEGAAFDPQEVEMAMQLLELRRRPMETAWWRSIAAPISGSTRSSGRPR